MGKKWQLVGPLDKQADGAGQIDGGQMGPLEGGQLIETECPRMPKGACSH